MSRTRESERKNALEAGARLLLKTGNASRDDEVLRGRFAE
jgi:hypothetical protein